MPRAAKPTDPLSTALASGAMARLVRYFAVNPDARPHVRALERATGLLPRSLRNELDRLTLLGVLVREEDGARVRYRVDESHPVWPHFRQLVRHLSRPADVLPLALAEVPGIDAAFIFGSHATDQARPDSDVDLFVVGDGVDEGELLRHTLEAGVLLDREVNVVAVTRAELAERLAVGRRFFRDVVEGAKQWVAGSQAALGSLPTARAEGCEVDHIASAADDPIEVLRKALREVEGVKAAFVFGSTARGDARPDSDIDVLIVEEGTPLEAIGRVTLDAEVILDRPIDLKLYTPAALQKKLRKGGGFLRDVLSGPKAWLVGSEDALPT
jgi:predicted nucleotidyltransferase